MHLRTSTNLDNLAHRIFSKSTRRMSVIAVGGFQHETNTFAPSKADYAAFEDGGGWPELTFGAAIAPRLAGANIPRPARSTRCMRAAIAPAALFGAPLRRRRTSRAMRSSASPRKC